MSYSIRAVLEGRTIAVLPLAAGLDRVEKGTESGHEPKSRIVLENAKLIQGRNL